MGVRPFYNLHQIRSTDSISMKKIIKRLILFLILLCIGDSYAGTSPHQQSRKKTYQMLLPVDNQCFPTFHSQDTSSDWVLSLTNGLGFVNDRYNLANSLSYHPKTGRIVLDESNLLVTALGQFFLYPIAFFLHTLDHESGHKLRLKELGADGNMIILPTFMVEFSSYTITDPFMAAVIPKNIPHPLHLQKSAIVSLAGAQANTVLSQKIIWQLLKNKQPLDNLTAWLYILTSADQYKYIQGSPWTATSMTQDFSFCTRTLQFIYGKDSINIKKLRSAANLDWFDPMWFISYYSIFHSLMYGKDFHIPMIPLGQLPGLGKIRVLPSARLVLTPYNVMEKRLITYFDTEYTPIKLSIGFGKESKTNTPFTAALIAGKYEEMEMYGNDTFPFFTRPDLVPPKEHNTYYLELVVGRLFSMGKADVGFTLAAWKQPEIFAKDPRHSPIKVGVMAIANFVYRAKTDVNLFADIGYKDPGFVLGQPLGKTALIRIGLSWYL